MAIKMADIFIYGKGGHAKVIRDILLSRGGGYNFKHVSEDIGWEHIPEEASIYVAVGDNQARRNIVYILENSGKFLIFPSAVHPSSVVSFSSQVGNGVVVAAHAVLAPSAHIGEFAIINTGATVDHDCKVGSYAHIAPGVNLCGGVVVGQGVLVGVGSSVIPNIHIGNNAIIGAGSVVVEDVPANMIAYGNPCRAIKYI